jgi:hypothetical protein
VRNIELFYISEPGRPGLNPERATAASMDTTSLDLGTVWTHMPIPNLESFVSQLVEMAVRQ